MDFKLADKIWNAFSFSVSFSHFYPLSFLLTLFLTFYFILTLSSLLIYLSLFMSFSLSLYISRGISLVSVYSFFLSVSPNFFPFCHLSIFLLNFFISWRFRSDSSHFPSVSFFIFSNFNYFKRMSDGEINLFFPKFSKLVISCFNFVHYYTYNLFFFVEHT